MRFVGLDVHKKEVEAALLDPDGKVVFRTRFPCTHRALEKFATEVLTPEDRVALEATTNTWAVYRALEPHVAQVVVSNPMSTKAIAWAKIKTDKVDAETLAQLLRCDYLPGVWAPNVEISQLRHFTSRRSNLVADRTRIKNRIHAVFHQRLMSPPVKGLFSKAGLEWVKAIELDELGRLAVDSELRLLEAVQVEIDRLDERLAVEAHREDQARLLMTLPGVDVAVALVLVATLGDIGRFPDADRAASYLGLVPSVRQSGDKCYHGRITKRGSGHARWMLVQAAQHVSRHPGPLGVFFRRLAKKKNRNVAIVATARKLVTIAYHMLKNNEPYRYASPKPTERKLSALRVKATGKRRKRGNQKGTKRSPNYGSGKRTRTIPSLDRVYEKENVPSMGKLRPGEKKAIRRAGVSAYVRQIRTTTFEQRSSKPKPEPESKSKSKDD